MSGAERNFGLLNKIISQLDARLRRVENREPLTLSWVDVTPTATWTNVGGAYAPLGYWKSPGGLVTLRGRVTGGAIPSTIMTLPVGFRPEFTTVVGTIQITNLGVVSVLSGSSPVSLDAVSFRAGL